MELLLSADGIDANAAANLHCVDAGDKDDLEGDAILVRAAREGNAGAVRALVVSGKAGVNRAAPNGTLPLVQAICSEDAACVEVLLDAGGIDTNEVDGDGTTPLIAAAGMGNAVWVQRLLGAAGVAVNHADVRCGGGHTALTMAAFCGHAGCVRALLCADGTDVNVGAGCLGRGPPLVCTIKDRRGDWEDCARALASAKGIDLNHRLQRCGRTALHEACAAKHAALVEHLLIAGGCRSAAAGPPAPRRARTGGRGPGGCGADSGRWRSAAPARGDLAGGARVPPQRQLLSAQLVNKRNLHGCILCRQCSECRRVSQAPCSFKLLQSRRPLSRSKLGMLIAQRRALPLRVGRCRQCTLEAASD